MNDRHDGEILRRLKNGDSAEAAGYVVHEDAAGNFYIEYDGKYVTNTDGEYLSLMRFISDLLAHFDNRIENSEIVKLQLSPQDILIFKIKPSLPYKYIERLRNEINKWKDREEIQNKAIIVTQDIEIGVKNDEQ